MMKHFKDNNNNNKDLCDIWSPFSQKAILKVPSLNQKKKKKENEIQIHRDQDSDVKRLI